MKIYTKVIGKLPLFILLNFALCFSAFGQNNAVSLGSSEPAQWVPVDIGVTPGPTTNVTIMKGDTISLDGLGTCSKLTIQKGAALNSTGNAADGVAYTLQTGSNTAPGIDTIQNDGIFGSPTGSNDGIALAIPSTCSNLKLVGSGITKIASIRPAAFNSSLTVDIAQNISLNCRGVAFSALPLLDSNTVADNIIFNIDTNKTVLLTNPRGQFHGSQPDGKGGLYDYNINGTLDLSLTTDTSSVAPLYASAASVINTDIAGKLKLGKGFSAAQTKTTGGKTLFNILNGGMVDATNTTLMSMGTNYFTTTGTGVLKRRVNNTNVVFPVGAVGSSTFSPVSLNNKGTVTNFTVRVKNQFEYTLPASTKVVNKEWIIIPDSAGISNVTVSPAWIITDQGNGFNPSAPVSVVEYNGTTLKQTPAVVSGLGSPTNPYIASAGGFTDFGLFALENTSPSAGVVNIQVFPNPTTQIINITLPASISNGIVTITTSGGQKITYPAMNGNSPYGINVATLPPGTYLITLQVGGKVYSKRFVKI